MPTTAPYPTTTTTTTTTTRNPKTLPKTIASTGLTQEEYDLLRQHLRTLLVPGSVGFDGYGIGMQGKAQFLEWFQALISEIGPIYWPPGRSEGLSWPVDRAAIADLLLKVVTYMGKTLRRGGKKECVDDTILGGVAGAVDRVGALHENRRMVDVAESLWDQMVLPFSHEEEAAKEDDWEQFVRWEMCEGGEQEENAPNECIDPRLLTIR